MRYFTMRFPDFRKKALTLSYDDDTPHDKRLVEILDKYGLKCTFNLNGGLLGLPNNMTEEDVLNLFKDSPHEVAAHGFKHFSLTKVDRAMAVNDVMEDRKKLEKLFGRIVKGMAYACGVYDDEVVEMLKHCGVSYCRTTVSTGGFSMPENWLKLPATCHHNDPNLMEYAKRFVEEEDSWYFWRRDPKLFYLWGHAFEFNNNDNWQVIEEFAKYMGGRNEIWYATNGEVYDYAKAFESLQFSVEGRYVYNPSAQEVFFVTLDGEEVSVKSGERKEIK